MARKKTAVIAPEQQAAIYVRVSTEEQASAYGLDVQRERCAAMAVVKGWEVSRIYEDAGLSGTKGAEDRPGLAALLSDVEKGAVNSVIVLSLDRLGRKTSLVLSLVDQLAAAGAVLVSCKESLDTTTPSGQFVLTMFAALAQLERDTIVERTTAGRNARGRIDGEKGGRVPFGYVRTEEGIAIDDESAAVVRRILDAHSKGQTLRAIAGRLNADGIASPRGATWHASSIAAIINNRDAYAGGRRGDSSVCWPPIIAQ